jgi:hypothetical protein
VCKCVLLPPGVNPIAVKYIISYHIISYITVGVLCVYYDALCCWLLLQQPANIICTKYTYCHIYSAFWCWANKFSKHVEATAHNKLKAYSASCWSYYKDINRLLVSPISQQTLQLCGQQLSQFPTMEINTCFSFRSMFDSVCSACSVYTSAVPLAIMSFPLISCAAFHILEWSVSVIILLLVQYTLPPTSLIPSLNFPSESPTLKFQILWQTIPGETSTF